MPSASMDDGCWVIGDGCWGAADTEVAANKQTPITQQPTPIMAPLGSLKKSFEPLPKVLDAPMWQTLNI